MIPVIGITGGIGSGKSTVARIFQVMGYAVYHADQRAKDLYVESQTVREQVITLFGPDIYSEGRLNKQKLAGIVFSNPEKLKQLNAIIHPAVGKDFLDWQQTHANTGYNKPFLLKEAAIMYEAGSDKGLQGVVSIYAPKTLRLNRVCKRDNTDRKQVLDRMNNQFPEFYKLRKADYLIYNDGAHLIIPQVKEAIRFFS